MPHFIADVSHAWNIDEEEEEEDASLTLQPSRGERSGSHGV